MIKMGFWCADEVIGGLVEITPSAAVYRGGKKSLAQVVFVAWASGSTWKRTQE